MTSVMDADCRRLRDYPGVASLERRATHDEPAKLRAAASRLILDMFEVTAAELEAMGPSAEAATPDPYACCALAPEEQVAVFRRHGWDVTGPTGEALATLPLLNRALLAACLGLAGRLPDPPEVETWGASLEQEAMRFKQRRTGSPTAVRLGARSRVRPGSGTGR